MNVTPAGNTPRSVDSYPILADLGEIFYNPIGIDYSFDSSTSTLTGNNVISQLDITATNINT